MIQFMIPSDAINEHEMEHIKFLGIQDAKVKTYLDIIEGIKEVPIESRLDLENNVLEGLNDIVNKMRK